MKKNSCKPINPKKYSCYGLKKNSYEEFDTNKKFLRLEHSPSPYNFSNGLSLMLREWGTKKRFCLVPFLKSWIGVQQ